MAVDDKGLVVVGCNVKVAAGVKVEEATPGCPGVSAFKKENVVGVSCVFWPVTGKCDGVGGLILLIG